MPTTITSNIGSAGGRDYANLAAWWAAIPSNLVSADEQHIAELYNDSLFSHSTLVLSGKTTDATRNIIIRCGSGQSFKDDADKLTNALRWNQANGVALEASGEALTLTGDMYLEIIGLQIRTSTSARGVYQTDTGTNVILRDCIVETQSSISTFGSIVLHSGRAINCIGITTDGGTGMASGGGNAKFHNCLSVQLGAATQFGYSRNYDTPVLTNCAAFGFSTAFRSGVSGNYNASDDTSAPGANSIHSLTFADQFENVASTGTLDLRVKAGADLIDAGTRDQTYTNDLDIVGSARSTTTPTIGPWEYAAGGPPPSSIAAISAYHSMMRNT